jgi:hypothetical protein
MNAIFKIILSTGFNFSVAKFYHDDAFENKKNHVISTAVMAVSIFGIVGCGLCFTFDNILTNVLFGDQIYLYHLDI